MYPSKYLQFSLYGFVFYKPLDSIAFNKQEKKV